MATLTALTKGGTAWTPQYVESIDMNKCLGCGRCFKVCNRNVLELRPINEHGEFIDDDDDDDDEVLRKVMAIANADDCIGCEACASICGKKCFTHTSVAA